MRTSVLILAAFVLVTANRLSGANIQSNYSYESTVSSDVNGPLDLVAELNYDDSEVNAPIAVVMHAYSGTTGAPQVRNQAQRLRDKGFFVVSVSMRGRGGSDGIRDSGGVEIHDIYDAVEAVKADPQFASLIDATNVHITGYSGGGGNTMSALTKFPDYFRVGAAFFGMADYGYDLTNGWYNDGAGTRTSQLDTDIGNPNTGGNPILDRYLARASNLASKNNPYSEIHLFVNSNETICPPWNDTSFRANAVAAENFPGEFDNITVHIGGSGIYEDFNNNSINDADELQSWPHGFPTANQQEAGELWYRDRLLSGAIPQPVLNDDDTVRVAGYVKTSKFGLWLGDGQNAAADLTYSLSSALKTFSLQIASSDTAVTGDLTVDTTDMTGRQVSVELDNVAVDSFPGGGDYTYAGLGHNEVLELVDSGPAGNNPPTLTAFSGPVASTPADTEVGITFAELAAAGDETDSDGTVDAFVVQAVNTGNLKLGADAGSAISYAASTNDTIDATTNAYWTPATGATGNSLNAFTVVARDDDLALSSPAVQVTVDVGGAEPFLAYHDLGGPASTGNITNHYVDASNGFTSSPSTTTVGLIRYSDGAATGVDVTITGILYHDHRTGIVAAPASGTPAAALFNVAGLDLSRGTLNQQGSATMTFTLEGLDPSLLYDLAFFGDRTTTTDGVETFTLGGADSAFNSSTTGIVSTFVTDQETRGNGGTGPGEVVRWTSIDPGSDGIITLVMDVNGGTNLGHLNALRLAESGVGPQPNVPPTLAAFAGPVGSTLADTEVEIGFADLTAAGDEFDSDGLVEAFVVQTVSTGTLKLGADAGSATTYAASTNDTIDATTRAYWTPAPGAAGSALNAFTLVARDDDLALSNPAVQATVEVIAPLDRSGLLAYYDFEDDTLDGSGNGNHGTNNGVTFSTDVASSLSHSTKSGSFAGNSTSGTHVDLGDPGLYNMAHSGGLTVSLWVKGSSQTGWVFGEGDDSDGDAAYVFGGHTGIGSSNDFVGFVRNATSTPNTTRDSTTVVFDNTWHHIVFADNAGTASVYIDGVLDSKSFNYTPITDTLDNTAIGAWLKQGAAAFGFTGLIDDVAIYSRVLDASDVAALAAGANPLSDANTFSSWISGFDVGGLDGFDDDADADGIDNGIENFFGTLPNEFSQGLVAGTRSGNTFTFTHPANDNPANDITAAYTWSTDLESFHPDGVTVGGLQVDFSAVIDSGTATVTATVTGSTDRLFVRVEVNQN